MSLLSCSSYYINLLKRNVRKDIAKNKARARAFKISVAVSIFIAFSAAYLVINTVVYYLHP